MPKEMDLIKTNTINSYVKNILKIRISKTAVNNFAIRINDLLKIILREGRDIAKKR